MGYACPVCDVPQADAGHLANHLAFTAITSGGEHEAWLDERVPDWGQLGEGDLAERIVDEAEESEFPQVFEESGIEGDHDHGDHEHGHRERGDRDGFDPAAARARASGDLDEEAEAIMAEARRMTAEMRDDGRTTDDESSGDRSDADTTRDETEEATGNGEESESTDE